MLFSFYIAPVRSFADTAKPPAPPPAASTSYADSMPEMKKPKYKRMIPSASTLKKLKDQAKKYTSAQIDTNLKKLPTKYYGNDPKAIFTSIDNRRDNTSKSEFETEKQFQERIEKENSLPIIGKISLDDIWSLQANGTRFEYSADTAEMNIYLDLGYDYIFFNEKNQKAISLSSVEINYGSYTASNSYGARTVVKSSDHERYAAIPYNYHEFPYVDAGSKNYIVLKISVGITEAIKTKNDMRVLLIAELIYPLISEKERYREATFSSPYTGLNLDRYIHINLNEIWIYNQKTGQIYSKIRKSVPVEASEKNTQ